MSTPHHDDHEDLNPTTTAGYKVGQQKTVDEYANLDANDESLNRWKASIGIAPGAAGPPEVTVLSLFLTSPTLPAGKTISLDLTNPTALEACKKHPITIKEGVDYNVGITFIIQNAIVTGLRYIHIVKRAGIKGESNHTALSLVLTLEFTLVDKLEHMIGSYGPKDEPHSITFITEESPSGMLARSGSYDVRSRVLDDDGNVHADFTWSFKLAKEW